MSIRICLIGDFPLNPDEGMKKSAVQLRTMLSSKSELLCLDPIAALVSMELRDFKPDVIQYISGPSPVSLAILKCLKIKCRRARTASMMTHPRHVNSSIIWKLMPPDLVLTFSPDWKDYLSRFKTKVSQIPGAVDTGKFRPVAGEEKRQIRRRLGLPEDAFIALHVGHLRKGRGLMRMAPLVSLGVLPVIVASESTGQDAGLKSKMQDMKCIVIDNYVQDIESYYQASDCYAFPTTVTWKAMDLPLSVIEAMACNLPVVSMNFGCVKRLYGGVAGVRIAETDEDFLKGIAGLKAGLPVVETRKAVEDNDWGKLANRMLSIYGEE